MRRVVLVLWLSGCAYSYLPTLATAPDADEMLVSTSVYKLSDGRVWGTNSVEAWKTFGSKNDRFFHFGFLGSFYYLPTPHLPAILGSGKVWRYSDGSAFLGLDLILLGFPEMVTLYTGASFKTSWGKMWFIARPGCVEVGDRSFFKYTLEYAAQAGLTFGKKMGYGLFAGFGVKDTVRVWRAGFYMFVAN